MDETVFRDSIQKAEKWLRDAGVPTKLQTRLATAVLGSWITLPLGYRCRKVEELRQVPITNGWQLFDVDGISLSRFRSQEDLAQWLGISQTVVSKSISDRGGRLEHPQSKAIYTIRKFRQGH